MSSKKPISSEQKDKLVAQMRQYNPPSNCNINEYKKRFWHETTDKLNELAWTPKETDSYKRAWDHIVSIAKKKRPEEQSSSDKEIIALQDNYKNFTKNNGNPLKRSSTSGAYEAESVSSKKAKTISKRRNTDAYSIVNEPNKPSTSFTFRKLPNGLETSSGYTGQRNHTDHLEQERGENGQSKIDKNNQNTNTLPRITNVVTLSNKKAQDKNNGEIDHKAKEMYEKIRDTTHDLGMNEIDDDLEGLPPIYFPKEEVQNKVRTHTPTNKSTNGKIDAPPKNTNHTYESEPVINGIRLFGGHLIENGQRNHTSHSKQKVDKIKLPSSIYRNKIETDENDKEITFMPENLPPSKENEEIGSFSIQKKKEAHKNNGKIDQKAKTKSIHGKSSRKKESVDSEKDDGEIGKLQNKRSNYQPTHTPANNYNNSTINGAGIISVREIYHTSQKKHDVHLEREGAKNNQPTKYHRNKEAETNNRHIEGKNLMPIHNNNHIFRHESMVNDKEMSDGEITDMEQRNPTRRSEQKNTKDLKIIITKLLKNKEAESEKDNEDTNEMPIYNNNHFFNGSKINDKGTSSGETNKMDQRNSTRHSEQRRSKNNRSTNFHRNKETESDENHETNVMPIYNDNNIFSNGSIITEEITKMDQKNHTAHAGHKTAKYNQPPHSHNNVEAENNKKTKFTPNFIQGKSRDKIDKFKIPKRKASDEKNGEIDQRAKKKSDYVRKLITEIEKNHDKINGLPQMNLQNDHLNYEVAQNKESIHTPENRLLADTTDGKADVHLENAHHTICVVNEINDKRTDGHLQNPENSQQTYLNRNEDIKNDESNEANVPKPRDVFQSQNNEDTYTINSDYKEANDESNELLQNEHSKDEVSQNNEPTHDFVNKSDGQNELSLVIYRADGKAMTKAYASEVKKSVEAIIMEGARQKVGGEKLSFVRSELVTEGYFLIIAETMDARDWLLTKDFGKHEGVEVKIRQLDGAQLEVWIPGTDQDQVDDPMELLIAQNDHRTELQVSEWTFIRKDKYAEGHRLVLRVPQEVEQLDQEVIKLSYLATKVDARLLKITPIAVGIPQELREVDQDDSYEATEEDARLLRTTPVMARVQQEVEELDQNISNEATEENARPVMITTTPVIEGAQMEIEEPEQDYEVTQEVAKPLRTTSVMARAQQEVEELDQNISYETTKDDVRPLRTTPVIVGPSQEVDEQEQVNYETTDGNARPVRNTSVMAGTQMEVEEPDQDVSNEELKEDARPLRIIPVLVGLSQDYGELDQNEVDYEAMKDDARPLMTTLVMAGAQQEVEDVNYEATEEDARAVRTTPVLEGVVQQEIEEPEQDVNCEATEENARPVRTTPVMMGAQLEVEDPEQDVNCEATEKNARPVRTTPVIVALSQEAEHVNSSHMTIKVEERPQSTTPTAEPSNLEGGTAGEEIEKDTTEKEDEVVMPVAKLIKVEGEMVIDEAGDVDQVITPVAKLMKEERETKTDKAEGSVNVDQLIAPEGEVMKVEAEIGINEAVESRNEDQEVIFVSDSNLPTGESGEVDYDVIYIGRSRRRSRKVSGPVIYISDSEQPTGKVDQGVYYISDSD